MPRYAPIPASSIDLISEAELVQAAAQKILEASNGSLNDFSAGNPLSALLEGQAFAAGEFLFWADKLPDKILEEWIGPFLGAMRRLGTPSVALLRVTIPPTTDTFYIPAGTEFTTDSKLSGGEAFQFVSTRDYMINPGDTVINVSVSSKYIGTKYNVPANSITRLGTTLPFSSGISVTNPQPSAGGSDVESLEEVKRRFLTLIRRRNPTSKFDWQEYFIDMFGPGTITVVKPNRSQRSGYSHTHDFQENSRNAISFFVLGPEGKELTEEQITRAQRILNFSVPVNVSPFLYSISLDEVRIDMEFQLSPTGFFISDLKDTSLSFRNSLWAVMTPGVVFPIDSPPSVGDIESAFNSTIPDELRFRDPKVLLTRAYNTPAGVTKEKVLFAKVANFQTQSHLLLAKDLIRTQIPTEKFYPVISSFSPKSSSKFDQTQYGNLSLKKIRKLSSGEYARGEVVNYEGDMNSGLRVILEPLTIDSVSRAEKLISEGKISPVKTFTTWESGQPIVNETSGVFNPDLIQYDYRPDEFIPGKNSGIPLGVRPGALVWVAEKNFIVPASTNSLTGAQAEFRVGSSVEPRLLQPGSSYVEGEWVYTPVVGSGPADADPLFFYVDPVKGAVSKYAFVESNFVFETNGQMVKDAFDGYVTQGIISEVSIRDGDNGLPVRAFSPRFEAGEYLEYRESSSSEPYYYISTVAFTPSSNQIKDLEEEGVVIRIADTTEDREELLKDLREGNIPQVRRMFAFFKGDQTLFRNGSNIMVFAATENVSPLFDFQVYLENGVFVEVSSSERSGESYVPFFRRSGEKFEDIIVDENGKSLYRTMRAFIPESRKTDRFGNLRDNTSKLEELNGNLLRIVRAFNCSEQIFNNLGDISSMKLGEASLVLRTESSAKTFVWGTTDSDKSTPELLFEGSSPPREIDYRDGTFAL